MSTKHKYQNYIYITLILDLTSETGSIEYKAKI